MPHIAGAVLAISGTDMMGEQSFTISCKSSKPASSWNIAINAGNAKKYLVAKPAGYGLWYLPCPICCPFLCCCHAKASACCTLLNGHHGWTRPDYDDSRWLNNKVVAGGNQFMNHDGANAMWVSKSGCTPFDCAVPMHTYWRIGPFDMPELESPGAVAVAVHAPVAEEISRGV